jgi:hypothetical protein
MDLRFDKTTAILQSLLLSKLEGSMVELNLGVGPILLRKWRVPANALQYARAPWTL